MNKKIKSATSLLLLAGFFASCTSTQKVTKTQTTDSNPPCHFYAGRLNISWYSVYDTKGLNLPPMQESDSLPKDFLAFKINTQALYSYLGSLETLPYEKRVISVPVNGGNNCILFHLEPSGTLSEELQKKFPELKSFKGLSEQDPNAQLRLDFDGKTVKAAIFHDNKTELISPWKDKQGFQYYLLYDKEDAGYKHIPFKSY